MLTLKSVNFAQQQFQTYHLEQRHPQQTEWLIGRSPTCDLVVSSPDVSRTHGRILYQDGTYRFVDMASTSGSLLNGTVVSPEEEYPLHLGDLLQIGEILLYVEDFSPPSSLPNGGAVDSPTFPQPAWEGDLLCRCCRIIEETADVKTFCFVADPPRLFHYKPGQFISLKLTINGQTVIRPYSISSSPTRPYHLSITVKRVPPPAEQPHAPAGLVSNWLHDHLQVGDRVTVVGGPMGHFTCLPALPPKLLLISAGSGITPMMSMARWVQDSLAACDVVFLHSARTPADIIFRRELETMVTQMANFHLAITLTQPSPGHPWMGFTGRISESLLRLAVPDVMERAVFVCGPQRFMEGIKSSLSRLNFPMHQYQEESFGGGPPAAPPTRAQAAPEPPTTLPPARRAGASPLHSNGLTTPTAPPTVHFRQSGQEVRADRECSILELAEQEGIAIRSACRAGVCGACKVLTREGQVEYQASPTALTATDKQAGYVLACIARPVAGLVVEA